MAGVSAAIARPAIFLSVLNETYTSQVARDWNKRDGGTGYVLRFQIDAQFLSRFVIRTVGAGVHREYWIPADDLAELNRHLICQIEVVTSFGPRREAAGGDGR